jgi:acetylornithine deacetylase/succinyl-diaminopimelate desuccinylase-like protein
VIGPVKKMAGESFPGVPLVPLMAAGATDAAFLAPAGIPTYGLSGFFETRGGSHAHGLNERMRVESLLEGRNFLYRLVKLYSSQ